MRLIGFFDIGMSNFSDFPRSILTACQKGCASPPDKWASVFASTLGTADTGKLQYSMQQCAGRLQNQPGNEMETMHDAAVNAVCPDVRPSQAI